jgi:excisionase family DNA binding protein
MSNINGVTLIKESILDYVKKTKNPYLSPVEIEQQRWLAGASHCTVRELMRDNKIPSIKVGTAFKAHYQDIINYLEQSYKQKSL